ncbi:MAG: DUF1080 domain-containing protein [Bacteroidetes bacterium]|nr:MAG: DUF1080 domain-containing protein [Bacteroidota bacterium]
MNMFRPILLLLATLALGILPAQTSSQPGISLHVYQVRASGPDIPELLPGQLPNRKDIVPVVNFLDTRPLVSSGILMELRGNLNLSQSDSIRFRIVSGGAFRLEIDGLMVAYAQMSPEGAINEFQLNLPKGAHPFLLTYFNPQGEEILEWSWYIAGIQSHLVIPKELFTCDNAELQDYQPGLRRVYSPHARAIPGDGYPLAGLHPAYRLEPLMESDTDIAAFERDASGNYWTLKREALGKIEANLGGKTITAAKGLDSPGGMKMYKDTLYVLQRQELTKLVDWTGDRVADEYRSVASGWPLDATSQAMALTGSDGVWYGGFRQGKGGRVYAFQPDGSAKLFSETQLPLLYLSAGPASSLLASLAGLQGQGGQLRFLSAGGSSESQIWLPEYLCPAPGEVSQLAQGPYAGQMICADLVSGGLCRISAEQVRGQWQGAVFRFSEGLPVAGSLIQPQTDGSLLVGGSSIPGASASGFVRLIPRDTPVFEMHSVRAYANGVEVRFTEPLAATYVAEASDWSVTARSLSNNATDTSRTALNIKRIYLSEDRKSAYLVLDAMQAGQALYLHITDPFVSQSGHSLWSTEAWYSLNVLPETALTPPAGPAPEAASNTLSPAELAAGWKLLFDGTSTQGWRNFRSDKISDGWKAEAGTLQLVKDRAGDIITTGTYENFELSIEWKIASGGNSGVFYLVTESSELQTVWQSGPEYQLLDDLRHPDKKWASHRSGSNYDLHAPAFEALNPVGEWNKTRILVNRGHVEHWLNGYKVVEYELGSPEWEALFQKSKFAQMPAYARAKKGHIALQDHGDRVSFRNIKIREL